MTEFFVNLLIYIPPALCGVLYFLHQRKKQEAAHQQNFILLYLVPIAVFTVANLLWSALLYGVAVLMS